MGQVEIGHDKHIRAARQSQRCYLGGTHVLEQRLCAALLHEEIRVRERRCTSGCNSNGSRAAVGEREADIGVRAELVSLVTGGARGIGDTVVLCRAKWRCMRLIYR